MQRLNVQEGAADEESLDWLLARIASFGVRVEEGGASLRAARRVRRLHRVVDPAGNRVELFFGPEPAAQPPLARAFPALPLRKRIHHFMLQANAWANWSRANSRGDRQRRPSRVLVNSA